MTHIIRQLSFNMEFNGTESEAFSLQRLIAAHCSNSLYKAMEKSLDQLGPAEGSWCFDRLEIDAGAVSLGRLEQELDLLVTRALEEAIRKQMPLPDSQVEKLQTGAHQKSGRQIIDEAFIFFLNKGTLPWSFHLPEGKNLETVILESWQTRPDAGHDLQQRSGPVLLALASPAVRMRLVLQFSPAFLTILLGWVSPELLSVIARILATLQHPDAPQPCTRALEKKLWETAFACAAEGISLTEKQLIGKSWHALQEVSRQHPWPMLAEFILRHWPQAIPAVKKPPATTGKKMKRAGLPSSPHAVKFQETGSQPEDETMGIFIENAGLVLLHPFLDRLFEGTGISADGKILQANRALCLLHYLVTGQVTAPEYELVLPRILCNMAMAIPVEPDVHLSEAEKEEAAALLEAVIRYWEVLQNTSPDELRANFLLRRGKLTLQESGDWLLQVEPKPYDILLDHLPWGIGMIKLPWMEYMLRVEWIGGGVE